MKDLFTKLHCAGGEFWELFQLLRAGATDCPLREGGPFFGANALTRDGNPLLEGERLRAGYFAAFEPHAHAFVMACGDRYQSGQWPRMEPPVAFWARVSSDQAAQFVAGLCPLIDGFPTTVFHFPEEASLADLAFWFTTEWWMLAGYEFYLSRVCSDEAIFASAFDR
jgi:hypothetical protein